MKVFWSWNIILNLLWNTYFICLVIRLTTSWIHFYFSGYLIMHWRKHTPSTIVQKQPSRSALWKKCSQKFPEIHRKTPVPESTFIKQRLWHRRFPVNFMKFLRTCFFIENLWWVLLVVMVTQKLSRKWIYAE